MKETLVGVNMLRFFLFFVTFFIIGIAFFIYPKRFSISYRGLINRGIVIVGLAILFSVLLLRNFGLKKVNVQSLQVENSSENFSKKNNERKIDYIKLGVPLLNQLDEPSLYYGCEVTSLAMMLNYYGIETNKNELAEALPKEPYQYADGTYGDPNIGFVGDMYLGKSDGFGVYVEPILKLAETKVPDYLEVKNLTGSKFDQLIDELSQGRPVWVITTLSLKATDDVVSRQTKNGKIKVSQSIHSVVLIGFDTKNYLFVNDPYGEEKEIDWENFKKSWEQMGCQALTIQFKNEKR